MLYLCHLCYLSHYLSSLLCMYINRFSFLSYFYSFFLFNDHFVPFIISGVIISTTAWTDHVTWASLTPSPMSGQGSSLTWPSDLAYCVFGLTCRVSLTPFLSPGLPATSQRGYPPNACQSHALKEGWGRGFVWVNQWRASERMEGWRLSAKLSWTDCFEEEESLLWLTFSFCGCLGENPLVKTGNEKKVIILYVLAMNFDGNETSVIN